MSQKPVQQYQCANCQQPEPHTDKKEHQELNLLLSRLDEQQRRWYVAIEAQKIGRGGIQQMSQITGLSRDTIRRGRRELDNGLQGRPVDRVRLPGGGRHPVEKTTPSIISTLEGLVEEATGGDPMSEKKWVRRSLRQLSQELEQQELQASHMTVRRLLQEMDYSLHTNHKKLTGTAHPDRDRQFRYIARVKQLFLAAGHPIISVDAKKRELIGNFKNSGRTWRRQAEAVNVYDFPKDALGHAVPYGIYDWDHNLGFVYVGTSANTAEFAVTAISQWWADPNRPTFDNETKLLILCDGGGSNAWRSRLWKQQLQIGLVDRFQTTVMVCHYPTGASKWNPIEHRLFSPITLNWVGKPLRSYDIMLGYIGDTTTQTGLKVNAFLLNQEFQKGIKISDAEMATLNLTPRRICPNWNYIIKPRLNEQ